MPPPIPYSARKVDLYYPAREAQFFSGGRPRSDAALCAEMARLAYCRQEPDFTFDQARIRAVLAGVGFTDCSFFESKAKPRGEGIHGFLATTKDMAVLAFRGTDKDDRTDLGFDLKAKPEPWKNGGKVHIGFAQALAEVWDDLGPAIRAIEAKIMFTGHSLGAGVATLCASLQAPAALYTFGSPRVGDTEFVATLQDVSNYRYVDCNDIVTRVPLEFMGYSHLGKPYYIDRSRQVHFDPAPLFMLQDRILADEEYLLKYVGRDENVQARELADHAPANYVFPLIATPVTTRI